VTRIRSARNDGKPVFLRDLWPTQREVQETTAAALKPEWFKEEYGNGSMATRLERDSRRGGELYVESPGLTSTSRRFQGMTMAEANRRHSRGARS
jgi:aconitate hydratase